MLPPDTVDDIKLALNYKSRKSVNNNLKKLLERNWIGYDQTSGYYFIRSFSHLWELVGYDGPRKAKLFISDINQAKAFIISVIIEDIINKQRWKKGQELAQIQSKNKRRAFQALAKSTTYFPVANTYLAKVLGVSISTAYEYKALARESKLISIKKNFVDVGITRAEIALFMEAFPGKLKRFKVIDGSVKDVDIDLVKTNISFIRGKKPKHINKRV